MRNAIARITGFIESHALKCACVASFFLGILLGVMNDPMLPRAVNVTAFWLLVLPLGPLVWALIAMTPESWPTGRYILNPASGLVLILGACLSACYRSPEAMRTGHVMLAVAIVACIVVHFWDRIFKEKPDGKDD